MKFKLGDLVWDIRYQCLARVVYVYPENVQDDGLVGYIVRELWAGHEEDSSATEASLYETRVSFVGPVVLRKLHGEDP